MGGVGGVGTLGLDGLGRFLEPILIIKTLSLTLLRINFCNYLVSDLVQGYKDERKVRFFHCKEPLFLWCESVHFVVKHELGNFFQFLTIGFWILKNRFDTSGGYCDYGCIY